MERNTVLITGANSGIGLAAVKLFLMKGFFVFAHYNNSSHNLKQLDHDNILMIQGDLFYPEKAEAIIDRCVDTKGKLGVLINNAGTFSISKNIEDVRQEDFDYVMNVNLRAPFLLSQFAMKHMRRNKFGRIINISSIGVKYGGSPNSATYTISKAALETMTISFAKAGAPHNVLVNALRVGVTDTDFHKRNPKKKLNSRTDLVPLKRLAEPAEIANTIFFLASEESSFITGSVITVAGGE